MHLNKCKNKIQQGDIKYILVAMHGEVTFEGYHSLCSKTQICFFFPLNCSNADETRHNKLWFA